jgi:hypothetical protein
MKQHMKHLARGISLGVCIALGVGSSMAAPKAAPVEALTPEGEKLQARYTEKLTALKAEITKAVPAVGEQKKAAFQAACAAVAKATKEAATTQANLNKVNSGKGLVEHAKGKWIGGAEKGIAQAEAALKKATTEAEREAAKKDLAKWQANKEDGLKALKERQAAWDKAKEEEPKLTQLNKTAQDALTQARNAELAAVKALLADVTPFLSSDKLDAKLVPCIVLTEATPKGLAAFAQKGKEQEALIEKLLADTAVMKAMLEAGGAKEGKYGQAMQIYADIQKASPRAKQGHFQRLALGTSLQHAVPIGQRNATAKTDAPAFVDPVKRYLHYEKACLDGELDPAFSNLTVWEYRMVVDSDAPDHVLTWGREMLRNYRPDHILNPDYGWRYSGLVRSDVAYKHSQDYTDTDTLEFFQNVLKNGGICGRRAFIGGFILRSFGIPIVRRPQPGHAALAHWSPSGWVVNLGGGWGSGSVDGRPDMDFLQETQVRKYPQDYLKALRAKWLGTVLGEQKYNSQKAGMGGTWNTLAYFQEKVIIAESKPVALAALGTELGEANESAESRAKAVAQAVVTDADKKIVTGPNGAMTIPVAACKGLQLMKSFLGGQQMICAGNGTFTCEVDLPKAGTYAVAVRVVTVHGEAELTLTPNAQQAVTLPVPFTLGAWQTTKPVDVKLVQGKNTLSFSKPTRSIAIKEIILTPVK